MIASFAARSGREARSSRAGRARNVPGSRPLGYHRSMTRIPRRSFIATGAAGAALLGTRPAAAQAARRAPVALVVNDASKLNPVKVARNMVVRADEEAKLIEELRALLKEAAQDNRPVAIGGAR